MTLMDNEKVEQPLLDEKLNDPLQTKPELVAFCVEAQVFLTDWTN